MPSNQNYLIVVPNFDPLPRNLYSLSLALSQPPYSHTIQLLEQNWFQFFISLVWLDTKISGFKSKHQSKFIPRPRARFKDSDSKCFLVTPWAKIFLKKLSKEQVKKWHRYIIWSTKSLKYLLTYVSKMLCPVHMRFS